MEYGESLGAKEDGQRLPFAGYWLRMMCKMGPVTDHLKQTLHERETRGHLPCQVYNSRRVHIDWNALKVRSMPTMSLVCPCKDRLDPPSSGDSGSGPKRQ